MSSSVDTETKELKSDIMLDLYYYQKELESPNTNQERKEELKEKISEAEYIYSTL